MDAGPVEFALIQSSRCKPDTYTVVHKNLHPVGTAICEEISTARLRRTEHLNYSAQRRLGTCVHVHRLGGEPDGVDADARQTEGLSLRILQDRTLVISP